MRMMLKVPKIIRRIWNLGSFFRQGHFDKHDVIPNNPDAISCQPKFAKYVTAPGSMKEPPNKACTPITRSVREVRNNQKIDALHSGGVWVIRTSGMLEVI
jgi:hypothetical protein